MSRTASDDQNLGNLGKTGSAEKNLSQAARRSPEDEVYFLAQELLEKLPPNIFGPSAHPSSRPATQQEVGGGAGGRSRPATQQEGGLGGGGRDDTVLNMVRAQEVVRFNALLDTCRETLRQLLRAIKGLLVMTESLDSMFSSLLNNQVPLIWAAAAYLSLKPLARNSEKSQDILKSPHTFTLCREKIIGTDF